MICSDSPLSRGVRWWLHFYGGLVTSDAGALLLGVTDRALLVNRFPACFGDGRDAGLVEQTIEVMVAQRVFGIALGEEDLIDHEPMPHDPVLAPLIGKLRAKRGDFDPIAGKRPLNRLEHAPPGPDRYHRIGHDRAAIERVLGNLLLEAQRRAPERIVLDPDATDGSSPRSAPAGQDREPARG